MATTTSQIKWEFDSAVTDIFDDMINRSIPQIKVVRETVADLAMLSYQTGSTLLDIGCSRGGALEAIIQRDNSVRGVGLEISEPMLAAATNRFKDNPNIDIQQCDLRQGLPVLYSPVSVVLSIFTLQFIPINYRQQLLSEIYHRLQSGGVLIITEKILGSTAYIDTMMVKLYHSMKHAHGYSNEEIDRKSLALEGVLVPLTAEWNEKMLERAGFQVDSFWRWMNFMGWVAYKV